MTKPVQIQPVAWIRSHEYCDFPTGATEYDEELKSGQDRPHGEGWTPLIPVTAISRVLEAKAAEWSNKHKAGSTDLIGNGMRQAECRCASELLSLAAILGDQGK